MWIEAELCMDLGAWTSESDPNAYLNRPIWLSLLFVVIVKLFKPNYTSKDYA